jgi:DNA-binding transcriptional LysR family regulator
MKFDLVDLRLFVDVAKESNLTRAAKGRDLSPGAASARIRALEAQAGMQLLVRGARGVQLTPVGFDFLRHAAKILLEVDEFRGELNEYTGSAAGRLRLYANTTAVNDILPTILPDYLAANPRISIDLQERPNSDIAKDVLDGQCDVGIIAGPLDLAGLDAIHFSTDRLVLATARNHRFATRKRMAYAETLDEDMVGMHKESTLQAFLAQLIKSLGKQPRIRIQVASFDAVCRMIGVGVGVGVIPESVARRNQRSMKLAVVALTDDWSVRRRYLVVRNRARLPAYVESLISCVVARYAPLPDR